MSKKSFLTLIKTVLPLCVGGYLIWHSFSNMSAQEEVQFYTAIREANYLWIIASLLLSCVAFISRAHRWKYAFEPLGYSPKFWHRYHALMIGYLVNFTIPRAGEASRAAMLYRSDEIPFSVSFGSIIAERAVDFFILLILTSLTAYFGYHDFFEIMKQIQNYNFSGANTAVGGFPWKIVVFSTICVLCLVLIYFLIKKHTFRAKLIGFIKDVFAGLFSIFKLKQPIAYIAHTVLIWVCYLLMFALPFFALKQTDHFPLTGIFLGFIASLIGVVLTPGGIGTSPVLVSLVVAFYIGDEYKDALGIGNALGWILWLSQTLLMIILGIISFILLPNNFKQGNVKTSIHTSETSNDI